MPNHRPKPSLISELQNQNPKPTTNPNRTTEKAHGWKSPRPRLRFARSWRRSTPGSSPTSRRSRPSAWCPRGRATTWRAPWVPWDGGTGSTVEAHGCWGKDGWKMVKLYKLWSWGLIYFNMFWFQDLELKRMDWKLLNVESYNWLITYKL